MTWNYPFSYALKFLPETHIQRVRPTLQFDAMCAAHGKLLIKESFSSDSVLRFDPRQIRELLQQDLSAQITHNVKAGLLERVDSEKVRYTWRGMFYLWFRFLWDFVRL
jgi:hypothetical protein